MNMKNKLLIAASGISIAVAGSSPAFAAGTRAGDSITNTVTVEYQVGGVDQTDVTASDTLVVDRVINIMVAEEGNVTTNVSPNEDDAVTSFLVTNDSNDILDIRLSAAQLAGGSATHGGTDNFDVTNLRIYEDTDNNGSFDDTIDQLVTYLDEVGTFNAGTGEVDSETVRVFLVGDIPDQVNGDVAGVELTGTAREGGTATSEGGGLTETVGGNTAGEDTVFQQVTDTDGDDYTVTAAALTALKQSFVLSDPVNGTTDPHMIPGATVRYCIAVTNAAGGAVAQGVNISDTIPANTTFVAGSIRVGVTSVIDDNGTAGNPSDDSITSCSGGLAGGSEAGGIVSASLGNIGAGTTAAIFFNVTIN